MLVLVPVALVALALGGGALAWPDSDSDSSESQASQWSGGSDRSGGSEGLTSHAPSEQAGNPAATSSAETSKAPGTRHLPAAPDAARSWAGVLRALDRRRAHAFAVGDPAALTTVYRRGSEVLARDRALLAGYVRRGLTVHGATLRLLHVRTQRIGADTVVIRVVDRLGTVTARTGAGVVVALPRDFPTAHRIVLRRGDAGWRIASVTARSG